MLDIRDEFDFTKDHESYEALKLQFAAGAIADTVDELVPVDMDAQVNDPHYLGPHIRMPVTQVQVVSMMEHFRVLDDVVVKKSLLMEDERQHPDGPRPSLMRNFTRQHSVVLHQVELHRQYVLAICAAVKELLSPLPNVVRYSFPETNEDPQITVVGDLHGQLRDLLYIFELRGLPSESNHYLFNGDFVDRGNYSAEVVLSLFAWKLAFPNSIHLNRGNHEARDINSRDGFEKEVLLKWDKDVFNAFCDVFKYLPLAHVLEEKILVIHGGLAWEDFSLEKLDEIDRKHEIPPPGSLMEDVLWSDPSPRMGRFTNERGAGCSFGPDVTRRFMKENGIRMIIRSHECVDSGYEPHFGGKLFTIFSASNYCDHAENDGAVMSFSKSTFPKPKVKPFYSISKELLGKFKVPKGEVVLQNVVSKLVDRIMRGYKCLLEHFTGVVDGRETPRVSKLEWRDGLVECLEMSVPWLLLRTSIPGAKFDENDSIDILDWLELYNPYRKLKLNLSAGDTEDPEIEEIVDEALEKLMDVIYMNSYQLESLFRWFDTDNSGSISSSEFKRGVGCLSDLGMMPDGSMEIFQDDVLDAVLRRIDRNYDGEIGYDEFFDAFKDALSSDNIISTF